MIWTIYNVVFPIGFLLMLPHFLLRMCRRGGYARNFGQRLGRFDMETKKALEGGGRIWMHAVSVGELFVAFRVMEEVRARRPDARFFITTTTSTGYALAKKQVAGSDVLAYFPVDFPFIMRRIFDRVRPVALILIECELWPNLIRQARCRNIPVLLLNGRISERSFRGYRRIRPFTKSILNEFDALCAQSESDARRLIELGAPADRVRVLGNAKYDLTPPDGEGVEKARRILTAAGVALADRILLGGSTWRGEEAILLDHYVRLRKRFPETFLVLAPRHFERGNEVVAEIEERGLTVLRRSALKDDRPVARRPDVLLVDSTGELRSFYACADVIFVGKSLTEHGGQNIIEPAFCSKPIVVGPNMENFPQITPDFLEAGALIQVADAAGLYDALERLLADPTRCAELGRNARQVIRDKAGAVTASADLIEKHLPAV